jgi:hypothetical protein
MWDLLETGSTVPSKGAKVPAGHWPLRKFSESLARLLLSLCEASWSRVSTERLLLLALPKFGPSRGTPHPGACEQILPWDCSQMLHPKKHPHMQPVVEPTGSPIHTDKNTHEHTNKTKAYTLSPAAYTCT